MKIKVKLRNQIIKPEDRNAYKYATVSCFRGDTNQ